MKAEISALPQPTIQRLCTLHHLLGEIAQAGTALISSAELGRMSGFGAPSIRKDISYLDDAGVAGAAYDVNRLRDVIAASLGLNRVRRACVVGLGRLGAAILDYATEVSLGCTIAVGFDASLNRIESLTASVPLHLAYEIADVVRRESIEIAFLTVPARAAQQTTDLLVDGGIKGIVNFTPVAIKPARGDVVVRAFDMTGEIAVVCAMLGLGESRGSAERRPEPAEGCGLGSAE